MKFISASLFMSVLISMWVYGDSRFQKDYELSPVNDILINAFGRVEIQQGKHNQLKLIASEDVSPYIELTMSQGQLTLTDTRVNSLWFQTKNIWWSFINKKLNVGDITYQLTLVAPEKIVLNGYLSANVHQLVTPKLAVVFNGQGYLSLADLSQDELSIELNGNIDTRVNHVSAGILNLTFDGFGSVTTNSLFTDELHATINGSIDSHLAGRTGDLHLQMQGSSKCHGQGFSADRAYVVLSGDSELTLKVNKHLNSNSDDQSQLFYYGNPDTRVKGNPITHLVGGYQAKIYY